MERQTYTPNKLFFALLISHAHGQVLNNIRAKSRNYLTTITHNGRWRAGSTKQAQPGCRAAPRCAVFAIQCHDMRKSMPFGCEFRIVMCVPPSSFFFFAQFYFFSTFSVFGISTNTHMHLRPISDLLKILAFIFAFLFSFICTVFTVFANVKVKLLSLRTQFRHLCGLVMFSIWLSATLACYKYFGQICVAENTQSSSHKIR